MADVLQFGMIASRRFWWIATQYGVVAIVAVVSAWTLIPSHGLSGAGMTMVLIFLAQLAVISIGLLCNLPRAPEPR
jgi:O-antigen/teichoic acid export membrane protein